VSTRTVPGLLLTGILIGACASLAGLVVQACRTAARPGDLPAVPPPDLPRPAESPPPDLLARDLAFPVAGVSPSAVPDSFLDPRGSRVHEAVDIAAARDTPVVAVDDGVAFRLLTSRNGGISLYHVDPSERYCYYYAHLSRYARGLQEGQPLRRGQVVGHVGTTGNAPPGVPHLHFAIYRIEDGRGCFGGAAINPHPLLAKSRPTAAR
jgi:murein DD-endopeptidase MepM/ murein hydrolase activator NlpD